MTQKYGNMQSSMVSQFVSKASDFQARSLLYGSPPKFIWLRVGNCAVRSIEELLRKHSATIHTFGKDPEKIAFNAPLIPAFAFRPWRLRQISADQFVENVVVKGGVLAEIDRGRPARPTGLSRTLQTIFSLVRVKIGAMGLP
jgi:hypothetical protein